MKRVYLFTPHWNCLFCYNTRWSFMQYNWYLEIWVFIMQMEIHAVWWRTSVTWNFKDFALRCHCSGRITLQTMLSTWHIAGYVSHYDLEVKNLTATFQLHDVSCTTLMHLFFASVSLQSPERFPRPFDLNCMSPVPWSWSACSCGWNDDSSVLWDNAVSPLSAHQATLQGSESQQKPLHRETDYDSPSQRHAS